VSISIQTLQDVLVALVTTVGLAVAVSIAIMAAGAVFKRDQARVAKARRPVAGPAQHPMQTDEAHEPVLL
jgi:MFS superfamily sulfate permease-like transporter